MDMLTIKLTKTDKGYMLTVESEDEEIRAEWGERIQAFLRGQCTCSCCSCGCNCDCECCKDDGDGDSCCK
ncbi:MAG: hypothetical protein HRF49_02125 [bacterium]